jgi:hypothetical protein
MSAEELVLTVNMNNNNSTLGTRNFLYFVTGTLTGLGTGPRWWHLLSFNLRNSQLVILWFALKSLLIFRGYLVQKMFEVKQKTKVSVSTKPPQLPLAHQDTTLG